MTTFPSPWSQDEHLVTRFPGPVTVRYRSIVCAAAWWPPNHPPAAGERRMLLYREWRAEDPELAEEMGLPRASALAVRVPLESSTLPLVVFPVTLPSAITAAALRAGHRTPLTYATSLR